MKKAQIQWPVVLVIVLLCSGLSGCPIKKPTPTSPPPAPLPLPTFPNVRVTNTIAHSWHSDLAWSGSEFGVSWVSGDNDIYFCRLSAAGDKIGPDLRVTDTHGLLEQRMVWTGSEFGLAWFDSRNGGKDLYFSRIRPNGTKVEDETKIDTGTLDAWYSIIVWTGSEFGLTWSGSRQSDGGIFFLRLSSTGKKIEDLLLVTDPDARPFNPSLAWTGSEFALFWNDARNGNDDPFSSLNDIFFARFSASGKMVGDNQRISLSPSELMITLAWTGSEFGALLGGNRVYLARISATGVRLGEGQRLNQSGPMVHPKLAWAGNQFGLTWQDARFATHIFTTDFDDPRTHGYEIFFSRLSPEGVRIGDEMRMVNVLRDSWDPCLAWTGSEFGMTWSDHRDKKYEIYFARVSQ